MAERVIIVDEEDQLIGFEEKLKAHKEGKRHRAFSLYILNSKGELLLQKRAQEKYHSGGLWTNSCCGHPRPAESVEHAVHRRLEEENGMRSRIRKILTTTYTITLDNGLIENEVLHIFIGNTDQEPALNPQEAQDYKYISINDLEKDIKDNPQRYTAWLKIVFPLIKDQLRQTSM